MMIGETIAVAFQSIRANKLRTALTMLGVIIGVAAVIAMVAIGTGAQSAVEEKINALGANLLTIYPGQSFRMGGRVQRPGQPDHRRCRGAQAGRQAHCGGRARDAVVAAGQVREQEHQRQYRRHDGQLCQGPQLHGAVRADVHRGRRPVAPALRRAGLGRAGNARRERRGHDGPDHSHPRHPLRDHRRAEPEGVGRLVFEP